MTTLTSIYPPGAPPPAAPYSPAVKAGNMIFVSGQIPINSKGEILEGTIGEKTELILDNIQLILKGANSDLTKIAKVNIFLTDMAFFSEINKVYVTYFTDFKPARSCVAVKELPLGVDIEIECIAFE
ncbi:putative isoleucine biosynthesis protein HMF1 [Ascoidea rubescens DSM 1968]|uniref:Putative L-PSP endoribonuclease family protein n=1 Tax=Ascoidea rubescens DSM 1968 TaxID=1344418 RepID=A0A1D2V9C5_9ASCO|nr:putative L-PSP endoribonuclease family protein [Ascoidea rubescens DSM 1968]ODV58105.1 putative L-PSP endoribonuclease family protein [Ascoidea rubescens DSM 1968]